LESGDFDLVRPSNGRQEAPENHTESKKNVHHATAEALDFEKKITQAFD
jgi:hypothetical protein